MGTEKELEKEAQEIQDTEVKIFEKGDRVKIKNKKEIGQIRGIIEEITDDEDNIIDYKYSVYFEDRGIETEVLGKDLIKVTQDIFEKDIPDFKPEDPFSVHPDVVKDLEKISPAQELELINRAQKGDENAELLLFKKYVRFFHNLARGYIRENYPGGATIFEGITRDDLLMELYAEAFKRAINTFDPAAGATRLGTILTPLINNYLYDKFVKQKSKYKSYFKYLESPEEKPPEITFEDTTVLDEISRIIENIVLTLRDLEKLADQQIQDIINQTKESGKGKFDKTVYQESLKYFLENFDTSPTDITKNMMKKGLTPIEILELLNSANFVIKKLIKEKKIKYESPEVAMSQMPRTVTLQEEYEEAEEEVESTLDKIKDAITSEPHWQYEYDVLVDRITRRLRAYNPKYADIFEDLVEAGFYPGSHGELAAKYNETLQNFTNILLRHIYPTVISVVKNIPKPGDYLKREYRREANLKQAIRSSFKFDRIYKITKHFVLLF